MDSYPGLWTFGPIGLAAVVAVILFRKTNTAKTAFSRVPLFLVTGGWLLYVGLLALPAAIPKVFQTVLGHSIWDNFQFPPDKSGTQYSGTWVLVRWMEPLGTAFEVMWLIAVLWAILNLGIGCSRKANVTALSFCALWMILSIAMWGIIGPF